MDKKQARAFEGFVAQSGDTLLRIATLLTCDPHLAEDVYQETLQRLAARWSRIDNPMAFCRRVLHNIVIDQNRARIRDRLKPRCSTRLTVGAIQRAGDPLRAVELRPTLLGALSTLTPQQRAIVVLRYSTIAAKPRSPNCWGSPRARSRAPPREPSPSSAPSQALAPCSPPSDLH